MLQPAKGAEEAGKEPASKYAHLSKEDLVALIERRDREGAIVGLRWSPTHAAPDEALNDDFVTLRLDRALSGGDAPWNNLIIEGDNYDALRWLRMTYAGRVKCIYVDPPYNTGSSNWVYNDRYRAADDFMQTTWLEFLHRRFAVARDLLAPDGVLLASINDENRALLELMLDQTMPGLRVGSLVWRTRAGTRGEGAYLSGDHEHVLVYANSEFSFKGTLSDTAKYIASDDGSEASVSVALQTNKTFRQRKNSFFPVNNPQTGFWHPCNPDRVWSFQLRGQKGARGPSFEDMYEAGILLFSRPTEYQFFATRIELDEAIANGTAHPYLRPRIPNLDFWVGKKIGLGSVRKKQLRSELKSEQKPLSSWIMGLGEKPTDETVQTIQSGLYQEGTSTLRKLMQDDVFPNPKPVSLIRELLRQSTDPGDLILDFFAGSGTTAHAVMELNASDEGERRFVMVTHDEATETARETNIARDVLRERIQRLNGKVSVGSIAQAPFAYCRTQRIPIDSLIDGEALTPEDVWLAVQAMHDLPLTPFEEGRVLQVHEGQLAAVAFCDQVTEQTVLAVEALVAEGRGLVVYTWTPGPLRRVLEESNAEIRRLPQALHGRFVP